jgi:peptide/nickel transport system permease protein
LPGHFGMAVSDLLWHVVLPGLTLAIIGIGGDSRFMRASMLDVINQDFVRTARAKGLPRSKVVLKHALRNALLPIITNVGLFIPTLVSGAVITETIFGWPGMGKYFIDALGNHDTNTLQAVLLLSALMVLVGNLLADLMYAWADPRIRYD